MAIARDQVVVLVGGVVGLCLGVMLLAGGALVTYSGTGMLTGVAVLLSLSFLAMAAGVWAGASWAPPPVPASPLRWRWLTVVAVATMGGVYAQLWFGFPVLGNLPGASALAVLLLVAAPSYATAWLLAGVGTPGEGVSVAGMSILVASFVGAAVGVTVCAFLLVPALDPGAVYLGAAVTLALSGIVHLSVDAP